MRRVPALTTVATYGTSLPADPYRKGDPEGFRDVHKQLALASQAGLPIVLTLLRNVPPDQDIHAAEREAQREWSVGTYTGFDTP